MLVFSKAKLVFLSVPKTGTTAHEAALAPLASMVISDPPELKHAPVFRYNRFFRPALEKFLGPEIEVLAVMREPISWLGSWYRYRRRPYMKGRTNATHDISFEEFVLSYMKGRKPGFANVGSQAKFLEPQRNGTAVTHLFRYEDPDGLARFLSARLGRDLPGTERQNESPRMPLDLSKATEARLRRKCGAEFDLWEGIGSDGAYRPLPAPEATSR
ncbi:gamma-glutamyl kinase [Roseovarius sp. TE539]|uniref:gamma-glutamyl kinase n=1 Tax=Roseovarius sp. TE539 TaxID=2249812 RepID=UPI000DDF78FF|nr:gamma-glutamyl kinase [Roseovarius sp. TE539]RBI77215.1 gamma-glutamyl kinase [Roseovarius sp. TE539]